MGGHPIPRDDPLDYGQHPSQLILGRHRLGARPRGLPADVHDVRAFASTSSRACAIAAPASRYKPPSENESGVTFTTPIRRNEWVLRPAPALFVGPGLRRATGQPRPWRDARGFALGPVRGRGRAGQLGLGLLFHAEHLLLALAVEQRQELLLLDRLAFDEDLGDFLEVVPVLGQDVGGALVRGLDDAPDLVVDFAGDLVGVVGLGRELAAEEWLAVSWPNTRGPSCSDMPKRITICFAVCVTFSMSFEAPVVISSNTISFAARPPRVIAIVSVQLCARREESVLLGHRNRVTERLAA